MLNLRISGFSNRNFWCISYGLFLANSPSCVMTPSAVDRETCACRTHANLELMAERLFHLKVIKERNPEKLIDAITCSTDCCECMYRECGECRDAHVPFEPYEQADMTHWYEFRVVDHEYKNKTTAKIEKTKRTDKVRMQHSVSNLCDRFEEQLTRKLCRHVFNIRNQYRQLRDKRLGLDTNEMMLHIDFSENYGLKCSDQCHLKRMDNDDTQLTCAECITTDLTFGLPPVEPTVCAVNKEKTTKKARRKANKDQADAVWKVCVPNCFHNGNNNKGNVVHCHLCQTWIHPECVGQNVSDIVGIWSCPTCRTLPVLVQQLRDGMKSANACSYADVVRAPRGVTLLVGNSLVHDIDVMRTADDAETNVCCKSGASFAEIGDMIDDAANHDKLNGIVVVGGTKEAMGNVSIDELKERTQLLITKAKSVSEAVTVGSMLPWRDHDPERLAKVNGAIRETCCEMCVKYVDHDGNFTFRDGTVDEAAYVSDGLHLSRGGVDRMLTNFALPKQKANKTERQPNTRRDSRRVTPRAAARETIDTMIRKHPECGVIITGDFNQLNVNFLKVHYRFVQVVNVVTRGQATLDKIWTNMNGFHSTPVSISELGTSDHYMVLWKPDRGSPDVRGNVTRVTVKCMGPS